MIKSLYKKASLKSRILARNYARKSRKGIEDTMKKLGQEKRETQEMAKSFFQLLEHKLNLNERTEPPSKEEVRAAIEQLKDLGRFSVFTSISLIPGGGFSLIGLEVLARKFGLKNFTFLPSAFREQKEKDSKDKNPGKQKLI
ncbi:MAG: hypothetical protein MI922_02965 [Bacteroidales bacterium]|nr:hypothetical protein [Bacteroidales bacterium]